MHVLCENFNYIPQRFPESYNVFYYTQFNMISENVQHTLGSNTKKPQVIQEILLSVFQDIQIPYIIFFILNADDQDP